MAQAAKAELFPHFPWPFIYYQDAELGHCNSNVPELAFSFETGLLMAHKFLNSLPPFLSPAIVTCSDAEACLCKSWAAYYKGSIKDGFMGNKMWFNGGSLRAANPFTSVSLGTQCCFILYAV